ncbi:MAG: MFS transporter [Rhodospirillaceae bacterium]|nr:MFS transporter [Rhodospirillaceae bacterium]
MDLRSVGDTEATASTGGRIGPIRLAPGIPAGQVFIFLGLSLINICLLNMTALLQPFVLTEQLGVPTGEQGRLSGNLAVIQQAAVLLFIGLFGAMADRFGRRALIAAAMVVMGVACALYPLAATVAWFFVLRFLFGMGSTAYSAGGATLVADFPENASRGKFIALALIVQSLGSSLFLATLGANALSWLTGAGLSTAEAGRVAFWGTAALAIAGSAVAVWLFKVDRKGGVTAAAARPGSARRGPLAELRTLAANVRAVMEAARANPKFGLVLLVSFVIRSDSAVVLTFLSLWVVNGATAQGLTTIEATALAGMLLSAMHVATLISQPVFGVLADRMNRVTLLILALVFSAAAFASTAAVDEFSMRAVPLFVAVLLIGVAEGALTVAAQSIFGQEAPEHLRGSAMGVFVMTGTISVIVVNFVGGILYDTMARTAPFVMIAALMFSFAILAMAVAARSRMKSAPADAGRPS